MSEGSVMGDEIMTPVSTPEAIAMAEIHALRQVGDAINAQAKVFGEAMAASTRAMEKVGDKMDSLSEEIRGVDRRLLQMEAKEHSQAIERLQGALDKMASRVDGLESTRDQQKGALTFAGMVRQFGPWLLAIIGVSMAWFEKKPG